MIHCRPSSFVRWGLVLFILFHLSVARAEEAVAARPADFSRVVLRLGRVPFAGPGEVVRKIAWMQEYLRKAVGVADVRLVFSRDRDYDSLMAKVGSHEVDIAWLSTVAYLRGRDKYGLKPLVKPVRGNTTSYHGILIARKESRIRTVEDLRGKRVVWVDPESSSGYIFPRALLVKAGLDPARDLREQRFLQKHDAVVWNVFLGKADAGACYDDARKLMHNPLFTERLDVIARTAAIPNEPIVCRDDLDPELAERIKQAFLALDPANPEHQKYLTIDTDDFQGFLAADDTDYDGARQLLEATEPPRFPFPAPPASGPLPVTP